MGKQAESHVFLILKLHDIYMASTWLRHGKYTKKWGPDKERINNDQRFKKARAHQVEFSDCSAACKLFRRAFLPFVEDASETIRGRITSMMHRLKELDQQHSGTSTAAGSLKTKESAEQIKGFNFKIHASLG
jgi:hypothetical protein